MSDFTRVHEGQLSFHNLIPVTKKLEIMLPSRKCFSREGVRKHDAKAKSPLPPKGTVRAVLHLRPAERDTHLCTLTSPTSPHREGGALENGVRRQPPKCAKEGK